MDIRPFPALRFDPSHVKLENVLTQPYDKITPEMQQGYYDLSPHNLVRFELGKPQPEDHETSNVYTRAAAFIRERMQQGVLQRDQTPAIYAYSQRFAVPGQTSPGPAGPLQDRRGFIALGRVRDYAEGVVFRHEQTLARPKADRLNLLRATRVHSGQIFMLYSDPEGEIDSRLWQPLKSAPPQASMVDEYGVRHSLWPVTDPAVIGMVTRMMKGKQVIIADGHHRYETALAYRNERRAADVPNFNQQGRTGQMSFDAGSPYEYAMMTFVNMDAPGLLILPTHRVVSRLGNFGAEAMLRSAGNFFDVENLPAGATAETALHSLEAVGTALTAFIAFTRAGGFLLKLRPGAADAVLAGLSSRQRSLDVVVLHRVLIQHVLGIGEEQVRDQSHVNYWRSAEEAMDQIRQGANVAFLTNPVRIGQMRDVALAREVMPQKSTDFYPKLMSGLTLYAAEDHAAL